MPLMATEALRRASSFMGGQTGAKPIPTAGGVAMPTGSTQEVPADLHNYSQRPQSGPPPIIPAGGPNGGRPFELPGKVTQNPTGGVIPPGGSPGERNGQAVPGIPRQAQPAPGTNMPMDNARPQVFTNGQPPRPTRPTGRPAMTTMIGRMMRPRR